MFLCGFMNVAIYEYTSIYQNHHIKEKYQAVGYRQWQYAHVCSYQIDVWCTYGIYEHCYNYNHIMMMVATCM